MHSKFQLRHWHRITLFFSPPLGPLALQNCKQQNNKLSLCSGGGEHPGQWKAWEGRMRKIHVTEWEILQQGKAPRACWKFAKKAQVLGDIYFFRLPRTTAFLNHQHGNITKVLEFLELFHTNSHGICIDHTKSDMGIKNTNYLRATIPWEQILCEVEIKLRSLQFIPRHQSIFYSKFLSCQTIAQLQYYLTHSVSGFHYYFITV